MNNPISSFIALMPLAIGQMPAASESEIGRWLLAFAAVAVIANQGITFWKNISGGLKETPPPAQTYVQKTICKLLHIEIDKHHREETERIDKAEENTEALRREIKDDIRGIHDRINLILCVVGELKGKLK
jgi:hypothetical protein